MAASAISKIIPVVNVTGVGEIKVEPDIVHLTISIVTNGKTSEEAKNKNNELNKNLLEILKSYRIESDIQTSSLQNLPVKENTRKKNELPEVIGYQANRSVNVTVRDLDDVGKIIDDITSKDGYGLAGIAYDINERRRDGLRDEALQNAMDDAKYQATIVAASEDKAIAGVGKIVVNSSHYSPRTYGGQAMVMAAMERAGGHDTEISPGEITISASVSVEYLLK